MHLFIGRTDIIEAIASGYACPDCNADTELRADAGINHLIVVHDDTCPTYQAMNQEH